MKFNNINLQLFAGELNTNVTTDTGLSLENKTFYDKVLLREATPMLIHSKYLQKRPIPKNGGKKIEFRKYAALPKALTPLTEGVTPDGKKLTVTKVDAEVSQYGDYVALSDVLDLTAIDNNVQEATTAIGNQAGLTIDTIDRNILQSGTNVLYAPKSDGTAVESRATLDVTCRLTVDLCAEVARLLKRVNAPKINGYYRAIIHPDVAKDLMADPKWAEMNRAENAKKWEEGVIGAVHGIAFEETSEAKIYFGTGCPTGLGVYGCLFFAQNCAGVTEVEGGGLQTIIKQLGSAGAADPLNQRSTVGWKALHTAEILIQLYLLRVECCSSSSAAIKAAN